MCLGCSVHRLTPLSDAVHLGHVKVGRYLGSLILLGQLLPCWLEIPAVWTVRTEMLYKPKKRKFPVDYRDGISARHGHSPHSLGDARRKVVHGKLLKVIGLSYRSTQGKRGKRA